jgi:hypothetical protein
MRGRGRVAAAAVAVFAAAACRGEEGRVLRVEETVRLTSDSASTLAIDPRGRWWLGVPGGVEVRDSAGPQARIRLGGPSAPRVLGWMGERAYLRSGDRVGVAEGGADSAVAVRDGFGTSRLVLDARERALYQGAGSGAVLEHDPATLEPLSGWPALAAPTTALAASPHGDRLYLAVASGVEGEEGEEGERLLIRDLQTGRVLAEVPLEDRLEALTADERGVLYGLVREGRRVTVVALRPVTDRLEPVWRRRLSGRAGEGEVWLVESGGRIAVAVPPPAPGVRLLDARDGALLGRAGGEALDFAFDPAGALWVLYRGVVRRVR